MANQNPKSDGAPPSNIHVGPAAKKANWLVWLLVPVVLFVLLFTLSRRSHDNEVTSVAPIPVNAPVTETATVPVGTLSVGKYLAGTEALPRTFVFDKLSFDTAKSEIRAADRNELNTVGAALKQYPNSRIRIVGYADARGNAVANATLAKARADSVKAALVAEGIAAERLETASGGQTNPVDTNATNAGQAENRRAELVVIQR